MKNQNKENIKQLSIKADCKGIFAKSLIIQKNLCKSQREPKKIVSLHKHPSNKIPFNEYHLTQDNEIYASFSKNQQYELQPSNFGKLKREAEKLDNEDLLGKVQRFSTLDNSQRNIHSSNGMFMTINKIKRPNPRKIAKGRPQIYNWVRKNNKKMIEFQDSYKRCHQFRKSTESKKDFQKSFAGSFLERLKKIQEMRKVPNNSKEITARRKFSSSKNHFKNKKVKTQI